MSIFAGEALRAAGTAGSEPTELDRPGVSTVVFLGLQGRFEIGGERVTEPGRMVATR